MKRKRYSDAFTQGGQTELHGFHMIQQVVVATLKISLLASLAFFILRVLWDYSLEQVWFLVAYHKACYRISLDFLPRGFFDTSWIWFESDPWVEISDYVLASHSEYLKFASKMTEDIFKIGVWTLFLG